MPGKDLCLSTYLTLNGKTVMIKCLVVGPTHNTCTHKHTCSVSCGSSPPTQEGNSSTSATRTTGYMHCNMYSICSISVSIHKCSEHGVFKLTTCQSLAIVVHTVMMPKQKWMPATPMICSHVYQWDKNKWQIIRNRQKQTDKKKAKNAKGRGGLRKIIILYIVLKLHQNLLLWLIIVQWHTAWYKNLSKCIKYSTQQAT